MATVPPIAQPCVSVLIVHHRTPHALERCLHALRDQSVPGGVEVWVLDNNSGDGSAERARRHPLAPQVVAWRENRGFGAATNALAARARGRYFLLLNPDVYLPRDGVLHILRRLQHSQAGALGVGQVDQSGYYQLAWGPPPRLGWELVRRTVQRRLDRRDPWVARCFARMETRPHAVAWLAASCLMIRREAWAAVGGFDERFFLYFEDIDLGLRLNQLGWRCVFDPTYTVVHERGASASAVPQLARRAYRCSQAAFWRKHAPGPVGWAVAAYARFRDERG